MFSFFGFMHKPRKELSFAERTEISNISLRQIGIGNYGDLETTGEANLLRILSKKMRRKKVVIFDVGANIGPTGQYTHLFRDYFPLSKIYAFEPNPKAYHELCAATSDDNDQLNEQLALGDKEGVKNHFADPANDRSELAGANAEIFTEIFKSPRKLVSYEVKVTTIDAYCKRKKIDKIDFLKIDVEGSEHLVLKGANRMISKKRIDSIQFEFNIHNIYSRIFIKDFYKLLSGYHLYRLLPDSLYPMGEYSTDYEIFRYQNILASKSKLSV